MLQYTLCSEKNTHSCFVLYLRGKCSDLHKNFRQCLGGNKYSTGVKVRYSLLPMTSCWHHISVFVNCGFYYWKHTFDETFTSWQCLWSTKFVKMFPDNLQTTEYRRINSLTKKFDMTSSIKPFASPHPWALACYQSVCVCLPTSLVEDLSIFLGSVSTVTNWSVSTFYQCLSSMVKPII